MKRQISSRLTGFYKFVLPWGLVVLTGFVFFLLFFANSTTPIGSPMPLSAKVFVIAALMLIYFAWRREISPLRKVALDEGAFLISDYSREIRVPASNLATVTEQRWREPRKITLTFQEETEFGKTVIFLAESQQMRLPWKEHPIVEELRTLAWPRKGSSRF
jgi:hypothetical protein